MIELHPKILKKNGKSEFVILPYEEFVLLQERLADAEDLADLRDAVRAEGAAPTISLEELKLKVAPAPAGPST
jgi:PHD/YefM family antitoxin component YafN of YafNO toxin-antitoxin module